MNWGPFDENTFWKSLTMPKKLKGGPLVSPGIVLRGKKWKTFLVKFPGPTGTIENFVDFLVEPFWSLQVYRKKNTDENAWL